MPSIYADARYFIDAVIVSQMTESEHMVLVSDAVVTLVRLCSVGKEEVFKAGALKAATALMKSALGIPLEAGESGVADGGGGGGGGGGSGSAAAQTEMPPAAPALAVSAGFPADGGDDGQSVEATSADALDAVAVAVQPRIVEPGIVCNAASLAIALLDPAGADSSPAAEAKAAIVALTMLPVEVISQHATMICQQLGLL